MSESPFEPDSHDPPLPPPVFPPGSARDAGTPTHDARDPTEEEGEGAIPEDAIHDPDDPVLRVEPPTVPPDFEAVMSGVGSLERRMGEVSVTGMGNDPHLRPDPSLEPCVDEHVAELSAALERLRRGLASRGEAALKVDPDMSRFDATLRAYCVGYLAGRRAEDSHLPPKS
jgi:hypothetical protein